RLWFGWCCRGKFNGMITSRAARLLPVILVALVAGGCGGTTRADWVQQVSVICTDAKAELDAIEAKVGAPKSAADVATLLDQIVPVAERIDAKIEAIELPKDDPAAAQWVQISGEGTQVMRTVSAAYKSGDATNIQRASLDMVSYGGKSQLATTTAGLPPDCGQGSGQPPAA
ncbi:MAG: hypothetical protein JWM90_1683, partial [Thermoleophilia bacterium]|nr:hypothetical protein [Thermoleophilia bacterium]